MPKSTIKQHFTKTADAIPPLVSTAGGDSPDSGLPTDKLLNTATNIVCYIFSDSLPHLFCAVPVSETDLIPQVGFTVEGVTMSKRILRFFMLARDRARLEVGEVVYSLIILTRLVQVEQERVQQGRRRLVVESNMGTLLLCAVMLANKWNRDVPCSCGWWAAVFGVPVSCVNRSELAFLETLHYSLYVSREEYQAWLCFAAGADSASSTSSASSSSSASLSVSASISDADSGSGATSERAKEGNEDSQTESSLSSSSSSSSSSPSPSPSASSCSSSSPPSSSSFPLLSSPPSASAHSSAQPSISLSPSAGLRPSCGSFVKGQFTLGNESLVTGLSADGAQAVCPS